MIIVRKILLASLLLLTSGLFSFDKIKPQQAAILEYRMNPKNQQVEFFWKNDKGEPFRSIENLKTWLNRQGKKLVFATNGGMYKSDNSPLGLYIEKNKTLARLNEASASGNFYLKPNGIFYITNDNEPVICTTDKFKSDSKIKYATQSGPMLVIDGAIHRKFTKASVNVNIRNGVGILPGGEVLFAMSTEAINLYDFADYFKKAGCKNALYFDGFVSRTYLPSKNWVQTGGNFGVILAETK
jgi:uncharacterized protein YigE (DUF2233 family)